MRGPRAEQGPVAHATGLSRFHRARGPAASMPNRHTAVRRRSCRSYGMVNPMPESAGDTEVFALAERAISRARSPVRELPERLVLVDVAGQCVHLLEHGAVTFSTPASTSRYGLGGDEGSNRTPLGWHRIRVRIGAGAAAGTVFKSR